MMLAFNKYTVFFEHTFCNLQDMYGDEKKYLQVKDDLDVSKNVLSHSWKKFYRYL